MEIHRKRYVLLMGAAAFLLLAFGLGCWQDPIASSGHSHLDLVLNRGTLRAGYIPYPPSLELEPGTSEFSGIFFETLAAATRNLSVELEMTEEVAWGSMIEAVKTGRVDLVCSGIWPNSSRAREASFSKPLYYSPIYAYARAGDSRFDNALQDADKADVTIAAIDGEMTSIIARDDFPAAKTVMLPQATDVSQLLLNIQTQKADLTFVEAAVAKRFMDRNPGTVRRVTTSEPVRIFPNAFLMPKDSFELQSTLNIAIDELHNTGFIDKVLDRYDPDGDLFLRVDRPYRRQ